MAHNITANIVARLRLLQERWRAEAETSTSSRVAAQRMRALEELDVFVVRLERHPPADRSSGVLE